MSKTISTGGKGASRGRRAEAPPPDTGAQEPSPYEVLWEAIVHKLRHEAPYPLHFMTCSQAVSEAVSEVGKGLLFFSGASTHKHAAAEKHIYRCSLSARDADLIVKGGIPSKALGPFGEYLGVSKGEVADFLDLDRSTVHRRLSKDQDLPTHSAEAMLRLMQIGEMAAETFESEQDKAKWLSSPHAMLDGETPLQCAKTSYGAQRVRDMLVALKYGGVV